MALGKHRQVFKRLNLDSDAFFSKVDEYSYLKNGCQFESEGDGAIRSVLGNQLIVNADLGGGTNKVIGRFEDTLNNRVIYFLYNSTGNHCIYVLKSDYTISVVMKWSGFNFDPNYPINGIVMYGNILIWCDGANNELRKINVATGLAGGYTSIKERDITVIKAPPTLPLLVVLAADGSYPNNYIKDNSFQFYYRYYYDDNEVSVWSATSKVVLHSNNKLLNRINIFVDASDPSPAHVTKIEYAYRLGNSNEFIIYRTNTDPASPQTHAFYNDQNGPTVPDTESFKWNDAVPLRCEALEMIKNRLFLFNYLENYTKTRFTFSVVATPPVYTLQTIYTDGTYFYWKNPDDGSYYGVDYNGGTNVAIAPSTGGAPLDRSDALPGGATIASSTATVNGYFGISVFHGGSKYKVGIMFFDIWGRQIGVFANDASINFPTIFPIPLPFAGPVPTYNNWIKWDFTALSNTVIPTWATSYAVVRTKAQDKSFFIQDITADVFYYGPAADGTLVYAKDLIGSKAIGVAIDISNLIRNKIGYTFNKGDQIKIYFPSITGYRTFNIFSQNGKFVNILDIIEFSPLITLSATAPTTLTYEIFTPIKSLDQYYEVGEKYAITNPGTGGRAFIKLIGYLKGDVKIILRAQATYLSGGSYSPTLPYNNVLTTPGGGHAFEAMNPVDQYFDQWVQDTGRGISELPYVIPQQKQNHLRWSGVYVQDSLINALSTFDAFDEYTLPKENGAGRALKKNDRVLVAVHEKETSAVYIGEGFVNTSDANRFLAKTEAVVGADNKYIGGFGTRNPESVIVYADRTYYYDVFKATFIRRSSDGLVAISDYGVRNWIKKQQSTSFNPFALNTNNLKVFGGYDPRLELCLWTFVYQGALYFTLAFHEATNSWIGFFDYDAEQYSRINGILLSFKTGNVWLYDNAVRNNFNGVQYNRYLEFDHGGQKVNVWKNIALDADEIWMASGPDQFGNVIILTDNGTGYANSGSGQQLTRLQYLDFLKREGVFRSAIFKDINTVLKNILFDLLAPNSWTIDIGTFTTVTGTTFTKNPVPGGSGTVATRYQPLVASAGQFVFNFSVLINGLAGSLAVDFYPADAGGFTTGNVEYSRTTTFEAPDNGVLITVRATITITAPTVRLYIRLLGIGISGTPNAVITISPNLGASLSFVTKKYQGNPMRSQILKTQIVCNRTDAAALRAVEIGFTPSEVS